MGIKERITGMGTKTLAILAMLVVVASAATVACLSNTSSIGATVISPFEIGVSSVTAPNTTATTAVGSGGASVSITSIPGGSSFSVVGTLKNKANNAIYAATLVKCNDGHATMSCDQLSLMHNSTIIAEPANPSLVGLASASTLVPCQTVNGTAVYTVQSGWTFPAGHESVDEFDATLAPNFVGDLNCNIQAMMNASD